MRFHHHHQAALPTTIVPVPPLPASARFHSCAVAPPADPSLSLKTPICQDTGANVLEG